MRSSIESERNQRAFASIDSSPMLCEMPNFPPAHSSMPLFYWHHSGRCIIPDVIRRDSVGFSTLIGAAVGGVIAFLLRPSVPIIGQLPFETVITAGSSLQGLDQLLKPVAQQSFKYLVIGFILGGIAGLIVASVTQRPSV